MRFERALRVTQRVLDESQIVDLWVGRSIDVNIRFLFLRGRATPARRVDDSGISLLLLGRRIHNCCVAFFLFRRWGDVRCLLLAGSEQAQQSQQVNGFFHIT